MASVTVTVTVYGGLCPEDLNLTFYKNDVEVPENESTSPTSFIKTFNNLDAGAYDIEISGVNPISAGASTKCTISTAGITLTSPDGPSVLSTGKMFLVQFSFTV